MYQGPPSYREAVDALSKLPGIGRRSAQRLVLFLLKSETDHGSNIAASLKKLREDLRPCQRCFVYTDQETCEICRDPLRDQSTICVVEEASDIFALEESGQYRGLYHVLQGKLSPLNGIGPSEIRISELQERLASENISELILAMDPDLEGDATAMYIHKKTQTSNVKVSRIAMGIPMGGSLEYTDHATLAKALVERREFITR